MDISLKTDLIKQIKRYQNYISSVDPPENDASKVSQLTRYRISFTRDKLFYYSSFKHSSSADL